MKQTLKEKIKKIALYHTSDSNCVDEVGVANAILVLFQQEVEKVIGEDEKVNNHAQDNKDNYPANLEAVCQEARNILKKQQRTQLLKSLGE